LDQFNFQMDGKEGEEKIQEIKKKDTIIKDEEELIEEKEVSLLNDLVSFLINLKKKTNEEDISEFDEFDGEDEEEQIFIQEDEIDEIAEVNVNDISVQQFDGHSESIYSIDINPKIKNMLVTGGGDDKALLWTFEEDKFKILHEFKGHKETVSNVAFSVDGTLIATGDEEGVVNIWTTEDGKLKHTLEGPTEAITVILI
jgi:WD40 repeat protein